MDVRLIETPPSGWDDMVARCSWGSFYHTTENAKIIASESEASLSWLCLFEGDTLVGGINLASMEGPFGLVVNALPYFGSYGEPVVTTTPPDEALRQLYVALIKYAESAGATCATVIGSPFGSREQAALDGLQPDYVDNRNCQITPLPEPNSDLDEYGESLLALYKPRIRTAIRKSLKHDLLFCQATEAEEINFFHSLHVEAIGGKGGQCKKASLFHNALELSQNNGPVKIDLLKDGETIAAGLLSFTFRDHVEYYVPVTNPDYFHADPLKHLVFRVMQACGMGGFKLFNFGGTWASQTGVYQFKSGFGAVDHPYSYWTRFFRNHDDVLNASPEALLSGYPNFFVLPFSRLRGNDAN